jgi:hypothetical protein
MTPEQKKDAIDLMQIADVKDVIDIIDAAARTSAISDIIVGLFHIVRQRAGLYSPARLPKSYITSNTVL